ncbi:MAG: hypothetical protein ACR2QH_13155 [Geminicoccaceae bacterium]
MVRKAVCFFAPLSLAIEVDFGSQVFASELVLPLLASMIFIFSSGGRFSHDLQIIIKIGVAYFFAQVASDLWNGTEYAQYSRGWARIFLFLANLISIYIIIENKRSHLILFSLGVALGRIWITYSGFEGDDLPWKIGLAKPVALLVILFCIVMPGLKGSKNYLGSMLLLALGIFDIVMDFRSHGAVLIVVAVLLTSSVFLRSRSRIPGTKLLSSIVGLLLAGMAAFQVYVYAAESGWLSENAARKYRAQVEDADEPLLIAGRSEVLVHFEAIFDSILIGHGSWPRDRYYAEQLVIQRYERGLSNNLALPIDNAIPTHSHIFGSWIEAGIIGGLFWANILLLITRALMRSGAGNSHMRPLYLYGAVLLLWDIFFSPFSGFRRFETAFLIIIVLRSLLQRQTSPKMRSKRRTKIRRKRRRRSAGHLGKGEITAPAT